MKKLLIALVVAGLLGGAVYGAAASIGLTSANLGGGDALVNTCAGPTTATYTTAYDANLQAYEVVTVVVTVQGCTTEDVSVTLTGPANTAIASSGPTALPGIADPNNLISFNVAAQDAKVTDLVDVHVLIDG